METLHLNLKRQWFDMILAGEKKEEYRDISYFWIGKLIAKGTLDVLQTPEYFKITHNPVSFRDYDAIIFSNGYSKSRPQFVIELLGIEIKEGNPEWGAEKGKKYFVLKLGKILSKTRI